MQYTICNIVQTCSSILWLYAVTQCAMYNMQICNVQYAICNVQYAILCGLGALALYYDYMQSLSLQCTICNEKCTICKWVMCNMQYTICNIVQTCSSILWLYAVTQRDKGITQGNRCRPLCIMSFLFVHLQCCHGDHHHMNNDHMMRKMIIIINIMPIVNHKL